jgi:hypothetical protein
MGPQEAEELPHEPGVVAAPDAPLGERERLATETEDGRGHEEFYVVLAGTARFTLDGRDVQAPGAPATFEPAGSEWLELARPWFDRDPEEARAVLERGLGEVPEGAAIRLGLALVAARQGRVDEALGALREAATRDGRVLEEAGEDEQLAPLIARLE